MKIALFITAAAITGLLSLSCTKTEISKPEYVSVKQDAPPFYKFKMKTLDGKTVNFNQFKGKKVLIVNVASKCGYTPQYEQLQQLHEKYGDKVAVIAFPANNFGGQEPGSHEEIASFCKKNYGVTFPVFEKISVKGEDMHPLYQWLSQKDKNGWNEQAPSWNFCKYLIDENGTLIKFYNAKVSPMGEEIIGAIQ